MPGQANHTRILFKDVRTLVRWNDGTSSWRQILMVARRSSGDKLVTSHRPQRDGWMGSVRV